MLLMLLLMLLLKSVRMSVKQKFSLSRHFINLYFLKMGRCSCETVPVFFAFCMCLYLCRKQASPQQLEQALLRSVCTVFDHK